MNELDFIKVAKALSDPTRCQILGFLKETTTMNCTQLCERFTLAQPTISHHIKTLESAGLISVRRDGQYHQLTLNTEQLNQFAAACKATS